MYMITAVQQTYARCEPCVVFRLSECYPPIQVPRDLVWVLAKLETLEMGGQLRIDPACTDEIHHSGRGGESSIELAHRPFDKQASCLAL